MSRRQTALRTCAFAVLASGLVTAGTAEADVISSSATLPVLGAPYVFSGGGSCFPLADGCVEPGTLTFTSVVPSPPAPPGFNPLGQEIVANATLTGELTDLSFVPTGPLVLTGTVDMEILGRTFSTATGSWTVDLLGLDLEGPAFGHTLTLQLDSGSSSSGTTAIVSIPDTGQFLITSFFGVFFDLTLDSTIPLHTTSEAQLELMSGPEMVSVPEPASGALLAGAALTMAAARRGRRASKA
jgi:hypothetical protein